MGRSHKPRAPGNHAWGRGHPRRGVSVTQVPPHLFETRLQVGVSRILSPRDTRGPLSSSRRAAERGAGVTDGPSPCEATWRERAEPRGKNLARGIKNHLGGAKPSLKLRGLEQRGCSEREGRRQAGAWGAPAPPAARPLGPGRAECPPAQLLEPAPRGHAGHEGVAGPAKHLPGHHRHPLRRHS